MAHILQVGAGSGGMPVLDLLCRDPRVTRVTLIEPDIYKPHNVERHLFPLSAIGVEKADLAERWLKERRADLEVRVLKCDLLDPAEQETLRAAAAEADIGVCAADNEPAKYHWDALMRRAGKPWTLGEVLSGGIGGFVHWFVPGGPCYGCVAGYLQRSIKVAEEKTPDYSQPGGPTPEVTVPASKASIQVIAGLHALVTLELLEHVGNVGQTFLSAGAAERPSRSAGTKEEGNAQVSAADKNVCPTTVQVSSADKNVCPTTVQVSSADKNVCPTTYQPGFTSLLFTLQRVPEVFDEAFRPYRFRIPRSETCLICREPGDPRAGSLTVEELDVALDQALTRLGNA
ncbi:hypothetical protein AYO40_04060 [Planctomycetaceae bacterium SCGC AG-212-D15]|nr:hypothetical protein AYO40_04060 [Planctomycetaceae bacterium SCGC AG-212-D15]